MPARPAERFSYAIVRVVPDLERGESLNAGVILHCPALGFLGARIGLDEARLGAIAPGSSVAQVRAWLEALVVIADGADQGGGAAGLSQSERFGLLTAPSSTVIQTSPVHTGLTDSPREELDRLFGRLVG